MLKPKYDNLEELLKEVQATRGLDTSIEFITHVQDLIGHSTIDELHDLSWQYKETFYRVYDEAEGVEATMRFFAEHSKFSLNLQEQLADAEADRDKYQHLYKTEKESRDLDLKELQELRGRHNKNLTELVNKQREVDELKKELTTLKAKLYDLMTA
jgi:chromosome segregation ATPase